MKIGISINPYDERYARLGDGKYNMIAESGFSAIDYHISNTDSEIYTCDEAELAAQMARERALLSAASLQISQVHGPWRCPPQDGTEEDRRERMEKMRRSLLVNSLLECPFWVVHPIMPFGTRDLLADKAAETWDLNVEFLSELVTYAKALGVTVCLENMPMRNFSVATPADILKLVRTVNDDHLRICLDTGHVAVFPELSPAEAVRELGDFVKVLHVHDNMGEKDSHLWPTKGIVNWGEFIRALREIRFAGVFSLESRLPQTDDNAEFQGAHAELYRLAREIISP